MFFIADAYELSGGVWWVPTFTWVLYMVMVIIVMVGRFVGCWVLSVIFRDGGVLWYMDVSGLWCLVASMISAKMISGMLVIALWYHWDF